MIIFNFHFPKETPFSIFNLGMKLYRIVISPLVNQLTGTYSSCRYFPTCSQYFEQAVRKYGWLRGGAMGFKRIANCHPGGKGGYKPVI